MARLDFVCACSAVCGAALAAACGGQPQASTGNGGAASASTSSGSGQSSSARSSSGAADAAPDVPEVYPAPHAAPPQVIDLGGPVLTSPRFVPVFFANEDPAHQAALTDFVNRIGASAFWAATTSEYGVGPGTSTAPIVLAEDAPTSIDDPTIQSFLANELMTASPPWPAPDDNTVYVLHYPAGTQIMSGTEKSCVSFGGYHSNISFAGANVAYAVMPECPGFFGLEGVDQITAAESHELIEAATDPYPRSGDLTYYEPDDGHLYWDLAFGGGEIGDMCTQLPGSFFQFTELPYTVQRTWSNASAKAGHDPCVPEVPGEVYFNAAPVLTDIVQFQNVVMEGVTVVVGDTRTIDVDLFSDGDTGGPWTIEVSDANYLVSEPASLEVALDNTTGQNGDKLHLKIAAITKSSYGFALFLLKSTRGTQATWWLGVVGN